MKIWYRCQCCNKQINIIENLERGDKWTNHDWKDLHDFLNCLQEQVLKMEGGNELNVDPDEFNDDLIPKHAFITMLTSDPDFVAPPNHNEKFPGNKKLVIKDMPRANWPKEFILKWVPESHDLAKAYMKWLKEMVRRGFDPVVLMDGGKGASQKPKWIFAVALDWRGYGSIIINDKEFTDSKGRKEEISFLKLDIAYNDEEKYKDLFKANSSFEISWEKPEQAEITETTAEDEDDEITTYYELKIKGKFEVKSINWHEWDQHADHKEPPKEEKQKTEIFEIGKPKRAWKSYYGFEIKLDKSIKFFDSKIGKDKDFSFIMMPADCGAAEIVDDEINGTNQGKGIKGYKIEGKIERLTSDTIKLKEVVDLQTIKTDWQPTITFPSEETIINAPGASESIIFSPLRIKTSESGACEIDANGFKHKEEWYKKIRFKNSNMASFLINFLNSHRNEEHWFKMVGEVLSAKDEIITLRSVEDMEELQLEFTEDEIHETPIETEPATSHTLRQLTDEEKTIKTLMKEIFDTDMTDKDIINMTDDKKREILRM